MQVSNPFRKTIVSLAFASAAMIAVPVASLVTANTASAQAISQNGGSIQGTITDNTGAAIPGAAIVISSPETGYSHALKADNSGFYSLGPLTPGNYVITVTQSGFAKLEQRTVVRVGTVTSGNEKLVVGAESQTVEVNAGEVQVNTEQAGVAGVVTKEQIDTLPINGRNILDIAQIQPGVELQSGQTFDPTKTGYSALAVNGQNGRSTRILVDGQDISDETVGTVLYNVPEGAIGEFQLNRSTQDVSGEVTSTGQVLLATQSGTNRFHGNLFYNFQDARAGFALVQQHYAPFQRNQFGGYVGGPIWKDKLFFFGGAERLKQANSSPVSQSSPFFTAIYQAHPVTPDPFKDTFSVGRLDYNGPWGVHLFARATYSNNIGFGTAGQGPYALFSNQDNIPAIVGGADFTTGRFTHSVRFGYLKFINHIAAGANALGNSVYNPSQTLGFPTELIGAIYAGAGNEDAPQDTYQSSKQFRYDGTWVKGKHNFKYGGEVTRINQGGFAAFYSTFLTDISTNPVHLLDGVVSTHNPQGLGCGGKAGAAPCPTDPLNGYQAAEFVLGNGNGSASERQAFGLPGGGNFSWRIAAYIGDNWKVTPSLTLVAGLRWSTDTDRANQDLATPTCGQVDPSLAFAGCGPNSNPSSPLFDQFGPGYGLGARTEQNYANFGPQAGFVFSPGSHKLVIRGGGGIFYESDLFNNGSNARAQNTTAQFPSFTYGINNYTASSLVLPGYNNNITGLTASGAPCDPTATPVPAGCLSWPQIYQTLTLAQAATRVNGLDTLYKAASAVPSDNPSFIGVDGGLRANSAYGGQYKTPYSIQLNGGMQYELKKGLVFSADFLHNATLKVPLTVDVNHVGAARFINPTAAAAAITKTTAKNAGKPCGTTGTSAAAINCSITNGATIASFAANGLDSGAGPYLSGYSATANGKTTATGAAFPGANANVGQGLFILPAGKSAYDALQIVVQQQRAHPLPGIVDSNMQISYNLSRAVTNSSGGSNQLFGGYGAWNNDCVNCFIGRNDLDHSNELSLSGSFKVRYGLQIGAVGHFFSAPPSTLTLGDVTGFGTTASAGAIFVTDVDGDGSAGDLVPGTRPGAYMHEIRNGGLQNLVNNYNSTRAGQLTPAGQALVSNGLMTQAQLVALKGVTPTLLPVQAGTDPLKNAAIRTFDASVKYPIGYLKRYREGLVLTPGVTMYNAFNMANHGGFGGLIDNSVAGNEPAQENFLNGPATDQILDHNRTLRGAGNGTFDQGGPRTTEFSLRLDF